MHKMQTGLKLAIAWLLLLLGVLVWIDPLVMDDDDTCKYWEEASNLQPPT